MIEGMGHDLPLVHLPALIDAVTSLAARTPAA